MCCVWLCRATGGKSRAKSSTPTVPMAVCKARIASGAPCKNVAKDNGYCLIAAHQRQAGFGVEELPYAAVPPAGIASAERKHPGCGPPHTKVPPGGPKVDKIMPVVLPVPGVLPACALAAPGVTSNAALIARLPRAPPIKKRPVLVEIPGVGKTGILETMMLVTNLCLCCFSIIILRCCICELGERSFAIVEFTREALPLRLVIRTICDRSRERNPTSITSASASSLDTPLFSRRASQEAGDRAFSQP